MICLRQVGEGVLLALPDESKLLLVVFIDRDGKKGIFQTNKYILGPRGVSSGVSGISSLIWFDLKILKTIFSSQESTDSPQRELFIETHGVLQRMLPANHLGKAKSWVALYMILSNIWKICFMTLSEVWYHMKDTEMIPLHPSESISMYYGKKTVVRMGLKTWAW